MNDRCPICSFIAVIAALPGPLPVALVGTRFAGDPHSLTAQILSVAAIALLVVALYAYAIFGDRVRWRNLGFAQVSSPTSSGS